jgi:hypothetical protein
MNKLPVFRTFGNAVGFTFGNFFTIFRLAWLPFAAMLGAMFGIGYFLTDMMTKSPLGTPMIDPLTVNDHIEQFVFLEITMILLQAIVVAAVAVSIHRVILFGDRKPGQYFNFAFGKTEFLYVIMGLLTALLVIAIMGTLFAPVIYLASNGDFAGFFAQFKNWPANAPKFISGGAFGWLMGAYSVGWLIVVYFMLRLAIWPPSVVATGRLSPAEPWRLTRGNVWRFIGLFALVALCLYAIILPPIIWYFIEGARHADAGAAAGVPAVAPNPEATKAMVREVMEKRMQSLAQYMPLFWLAYLFFYIFITGLSVALISYSYKALKGYDAAAPIPEGG